MLTETIRALIAQADQAIREERFDDLMECYTEDAVLVVRPGLEVRGKTAIRAAFVKIAEYFNHSLVPSQGNMIVIDAGDTALVLSQSFVPAELKPDSEYPSERRATYVYRLVNGKWLCAIDNSDGTTLLDSFQ